MGAIYFPTPGGGVCPRSRSCHEPAVRSPTVNGSFRFILYTQYFAPEIGATQSRLLALSRELTTLGHSVEVVTAMPNHLKGRIFSEYAGRLYLSENIGLARVHRTWVYAAARKSVAARLLNYGSFIATSPLGLLKAQAADYLFVQSPPMFPILPAAIFASLHRGIKIILDVADIWPKSVEMLGVVRNGLALGTAARLERFAYKRSYAVNAATVGIFKELTEQKGVDRGKVLFLP